MNDKTVLQSLLNPNLLRIDEFSKSARYNIDRFIRDCKANNLPPTYNYFTMWMVVNGWMERPGGHFN